MVEEQKQYSISYHPIKDIPISELIKVREIENGKYVKLINLKEDEVTNGENIILNYSRFQEWLKKWDKYTRSCRGLVINTKTQEIVALPFPKFDNIFDLEIIKNQRNDIAYITEKADGSLGISYFDNTLQKWRMNTKGSFNSEQAQVGTQLLYDHVNLDALDKDLTYLFEIIYKENQILVSYGDLKALVLITAFSKKTLLEVPFSEVILIYEQIALPQSKNKFIKIVELFNIDEFFQKIDDQYNNLKNFEGWVVTMKNGLKFKIKCVKYFEQLKYKALIHPLGVYKQLEDIGFDLEKIQSLDIPDEFHEEFSKTVQSFRLQHKQIFDNITACLQKYQQLDNKQLAAQFQIDNVDSILKKGVFSLRNSKQDRLDKDIWHHIRPSGETQAIEKDE